MRYLNRRVFFMMLSGCLENCLPWDFALRFALVVAAYSAGLSALIAASGKYLSPVSLDFLPDFVRHFCLPQSVSDFCGARISFCNPRPSLYIFWPGAEPSELTICQRLCRARSATEDGLKQTFPHAWHVVAGLIDLTLGHYFFFTGFFLPAIFMMLFLVP